IGDLQVSSWTKDSVTVNGCRCEFAGDGKRLVCPDHTYEAGAARKAVVVSKTGTTRERDYKPTDVRTDLPPPPPPSAGARNLGEMDFHGMKISVLFGSDKQGRLAVGIVSEGPADDAIIKVAGKEIVVTKEQILVGGVTKAKLP